MSDYPQQKLCEIVTSYGQQVTDNASACRGLMMDLCENYPRYQREIRVITDAITYGIVADLQSPTNLLPLEILLSRHVQRLTAMGLDEALARWGVESWAVALRQLSIDSVHPRYQGSRTLLISNKGGGHYTSINEAMKGAVDGDKLLISSGVYRESIILHKQVELLGDGLVEEIIIESKNAPCITIQTQEAIIQGLTLRTISGEVGQKYCAIDIPIGHIKLVGCDISSATSVCVRVAGATTQPIIRACRLHHGKEGGIQFFDSAIGRMEHCEIFDNGLAGVSIRQNSNPVIYQCTIRNERVGILIFESGCGEIKESNIVSPLNFGIELRQGANPVIDGCKVTSAPGCGILCWEQGLGVITNCDIASSGLAGVEVRHGGNAILRKCKIHGGKGPGILVREGGEGQFEECEIFENTQASVEIKSRGNSQLRRCNVHHTRGSGILIHDGGQGSIENCKIVTHTRAGIEIKNHGNALIQSCAISEARESGVLVWQNSTAAIENCDIFSNNGGGVAVKLHSSVTACSSYIHQNGREAFIIQQMSKVTVEGCNLKENSHKGIWNIESGCQVDGRGNKE